MNENRERDFIERQTNRDISRRRALDWMLKVGYSATAASFLAATATSCGGDRQFGDITGESEGFGESSDTLKIAVVAPFSGIGSFLGAVAQRSLDAAVQHVNSEGGIGGRKVELVTKDVNAADFQAAMNVYQDLAGQGDVAGIIWALTTHLVELQDRIAVDRIPIAVAFANLHDSNDLYPANQAMRPLFQFLIPDSWTMRVLADYCKNDRGYSRVAFVYDENLFADDVPAFEKTMAETGLSTTTITSYPLNNSNFAPQIQATEGAQALWFWGLGTDIANAVKQLADVEKDYTYIGDALSAKRPHLMGTQAALGEKKWAELAGAAAKAGTLTTWHVGGLIYLPTFQIRDWMRAYTNELPSGGEETPADAMYTIANAVKNAGSLDRDKMIAAIENAGKQKFASLDFEFTPDNHLARHPDDLIMVTLERENPALVPGTTQPTYEVGREWKEFFPPGYAGPTHLIRPTLEANMRRHPEVMKQVLEEGWGTNAPAGDPIH